MSATKFHIHTKQEAKLYFYIYWSLNFLIANWKTIASVPSGSKQSVRFGCSDRSIDTCRAKYYENRSTRNGWDHEVSALGTLSDPSHITLQCLPLLPALQGTNWGPRKSSVRTIFCKLLDRMFKKQSGIEHCMTQHCTNWWQHSGWCNYAQFALRIQKWLINLFKLSSYFT